MSLRRHTFYAAVFLVNLIGWGLIILTGYVLILYLGNLLK